MLGGALLALVVVGTLLIRLDGACAGRRGAPAWWFAALFACLVLGAGAGAALAARSDRGLDGTVSHAWSASPACGATGRVTPPA